MSPSCGKGDLAYILYVSPAVSKSTPSALSPLPFAKAEMSPSGVYHLISYAGDPWALSCHERTHIVEVAVLRAGQVTSVT